jgi:site-specific DNA-methyltransferase (adenine-specific)
VRGWIFWDKHVPEGVSFSDGELAWTSFDCVLKKADCPYSGFNGSEGKIHPTHKPIALYKWLLKNYAKQGDKILDTHLGSGSSRIAAFDMGFDFWGYELDKDYFEAQEKRFQNHIAQLKLFQP